MGKKHDFVLDFGPFGANLPPIFFYIIANYHRIQFQEKLEISEYLKKLMIQS